MFKSRASASVRCFIVSSASRAWYAASACFSSSVGWSGEVTLGGDSIRSLAVVSRLRKAGLPANVGDIYQHPTVTQLADVLRRFASELLETFPVQGIPHQLLGKRRQADVQFAHLAGEVAE